MSKISRDVIFSEKKNTCGSAPVNLFERPYVKEVAVLSILLILLHGNSFLDGGGPLACSALAMIFYSCPGRRMGSLSPCAPEQTFPELGRDQVSGWLEASCSLLSLMLRDGVVSFVLLCAQLREWQFLWSRLYILVS